MARIEHFALFADDPHELRKFYEDTFGMRTVLDNSQGKPAGFFLADDQGNCLEIIGRLPEQPGREVSQRYICHVAFLVDDVDQTKTALESKGFVFETETVVDNQQMKTCFFRDPANNRCQIIWRAKPLV